MVGCGVSFLTGPLTVSQPRLATWRTRSRYPDAEREESGRSQTQFCSNSRAAGVCQPRLSSVLRKVTVCSTLSFTSVSLTALFHVTRPPGLAARGESKDREKSGTASQFASRQALFFEGHDRGGRWQYPFFDAARHLPRAVILRRTRVANKSTKVGGNPILTSGGLAFAIDYPIGDGVQRTSVIRVGEMAQFSKGFFSELKRPSLSLLDGIVFL